MNNMEKEIKEIAIELQENKPLYELMKRATEFTPEQIQTIITFLESIK